MRVRRMDRQPARLLCGRDGGEEMGGGYGACGLIIPLLISIFVYSLMRVWDRRGRDLILFAEYALVSWLPVGRWVRTPLGSSFIE